MWPAGVIRGFFRTETGCRAGPSSRGDICGPWRNALSTASLTAAPPRLSRHLRVLPPVAPARSRDDLLADRVRSGDQEAYGELVAPHMGRLARALRPLARDDDDNQDLVQETLLRALRNLHRFDGGRFGTWLIRVGVNLALTAARRHTVGRRIIDPEQGLGAEFCPKSPRNPVDAVLLSEDVERLSRAMEDLPGPCRVAFHLRHVGELSCMDIAERMGKTPNAISLLLFRARRRLRDALRAGGTGTPVHNLG